MIAGETLGRRARRGKSEAHARSLEDRIDLRNAKKALKERGSVSWKTVKADLGL